MKKICDVCGKRVWPWQKKRKMTKIEPILKNPDVPNIEEVTKELDAGKGSSVHIHIKCVEAI